MHTYNVQRPFAKFVDSPYHSKLKLCEGTVMVSFSKYLPWQMMHFLQHLTHFLKTCCRPLITSKFLALELAFLPLSLNHPLLPCGVEGFFFTCESIRQLVGLLGQVISPTQGLYLHTGQHNTEKCRHTSMP
jgi:hypothetical protein